MSKDTITTHAEALRLIDEHIGEKVYLAVLVTRGEPDHPEDPVPIFHKIGPLSNPLAPEPPRLQPDEGWLQTRSGSQPTRTAIGSALCRSSRTRSSRGRSSAGGGS
jgi:hypothetical protein